LSACHAHDLLNNLIRPQQQRRRDGKAERFGGLEIDDQSFLRELATVAGKPAVLTMENMPDAVILRADPGVIS
jgi:hypothetical protein